MRVNNSNLFKIDPREGKYVLKEVSTEVSEIYYYTTNEANMQWLFREYKIEASLPSRVPNSNLIKCLQVKADAGVVRSILDICKYTEVNFKYLSISDKDLKFVFRENRAKAILLRPRVSAGAGGSYGEGAGAGRHVGRYNSETDVGKGAGRG